MESGDLESIALLASSGLLGWGLATYLIYDGLNRFDRMVENYCLERAMSKGIITKPGSNFARYEPDKFGR
jgi:hypothetical protein